MALSHGNPVSAHDTKSLAEVSACKGILLSEKACDRKRMIIEQGQIEEIQIYDNQFQDVPVTFTSLEEESQYIKNNFNTCFLSQYNFYFDEAEKPKAQDRGTYFSIVSHCWFPLKSFQVNEYSQPKLSQDALQLIDKITKLYETGDRDKENQQNIKTFLETYGSHIVPAFYGGQILKRVSCYDFAEDERVEIEKLVLQVSSKMRQGYDPPLGQLVQRRTFEYQKRKCQCHITSQVMVYPSLENSDNLSDWEKNLQQNDLLMECINDYPSPDCCIPVWHIFYNHDQLSKHVRWLTYNFEEMCDAMQQERSLKTDVEAYTQTPGNETTRTNDREFQSVNKLASRNDQDREHQAKMETVGMPPITVTANQENAREGLTARDSPNPDVFIQEQKENISSEVNKHMSRTTCESFAFADQRNCHEVNTFHEHTFNPYRFYGYHQNSARGNKVHSNEQYKYQSQERENMSELTANKPDNANVPLHKTFQPYDTPQHAHHQQDAFLLQQREYPSYLGMPSYPFYEYSDSQWLPQNVHPYDYSILSKYGQYNPSCFPRMPPVSNLVNSLTEQTNSSLPIAEDQHQSLQKDQIYPFTQFEGDNNATYNTTLKQKPSTRVSSGPRDIADLLTQMGLNHSYLLGIKDIMTVRRHHLHPCDETSDKVGTFFAALTALDYRSLVSMSISIKNSISSSHIPVQNQNWLKTIRASENQEHQPRDGLSSLDAAHAIINKSDPFLQQELLTKMSACQLAVPLILPDLSGKKLTYMSWALSGICKTWKDFGSDSVSEEFIIMGKLPIVAFMRIGEMDASKSNIINKIIGTVQGNDEHAFFISSEQDSVASSWSKGTVEVVWFLPKGTEKSTAKLSRALTILNLRGSGSDYKTQTNLLCQVADEVILFINENQLEHYEREVSEMQETAKHMLLILNAGIEKSHFRKNDASYKNMKILDVKGFTTLEIATKLGDMIKFAVTRVKPSKSLKDHETTCKNLQIEIDAEKGECISANKTFEQILRSISKSPLQYKRQVFPLQTNYWKKWASLDKEKSRKVSGVKDIEHYYSSIDTKKAEIRKQQILKGPSKEVLLFYESLSKASPAGRQYLLLKMQSHLNEMSRLSLRPLIDQLKQLKSQSRKASSSIKVLKKTMKIDSPLSAKSKSKTLFDKLRKESENIRKEIRKVTCEFDAISIGLEHFIREMGQIYESHIEIEHPKQGSISTDFIDGLPRLLAELMLEGQHLEILDGDAAHVPLKWITGVLESLQEKVGDARLYVISVIGIQSSGKSTLMNSMFGVRFPVSAGRCTKGIFIQLLPVEQSFRETIKCDFLVIVDTEGLRAPERAIMDNNEEDNELATFALCLSDLTLINIGGQTVGEDMTNVLEIAAHAFIRMKEVNLKSECRLVQQFVADISAVHRNETSTQSILLKLDEATAAAAREEGRQNQYNSFSDIFNLRLGTDEDEDLQYIPSLWRGVMAPPNHVYSETVLRLKGTILQGMVETAEQGRWTLPEFTKRISDVWNAIKEEDFIFSFQNNVEAMYYGAFQWKYGSWVMSMRNEIMNWELNALTAVKNSSAQNVDARLHELYKDLEKMVSDEVDTIRSKISECLGESAKEAEILRRHEHFFISDLEHVQQDVIRTARHQLEQAAGYLRQTDDLVKLLPKVRAELLAQVRPVAMTLRQNHKEKSGQEIIPDKDIQEAFEVEWEKGMNEIQRKYPPENIPYNQIETQIKACLLTSVDKTPISMETKKILRDLGALSKLVGRPGSYVQSDISDQDIMKIIHSCKTTISEQLKITENFHENIVRRTTKTAYNCLKGKKLTGHKFMSALLHVCGWAMEEVQEIYNNALIVKFLKDEEIRKKFTEEIFTRNEIDKAFRRELKNVTKNEPDAVQISDVLGAGKITPKLQENEQQQQGIKQMICEAFISAMAYLKKDESVSYAFEISKDFFTEHYICSTDKPLDIRIIKLFCSVVLQTMNNNRVSSKQRIDFMVLSCSWAIDQIEMNQRSRCHYLLQNNEKLRKEVSFEVGSTDDLEKIFLEQLREVCKNGMPASELNNYIKEGNLIKFLRGCWNEHSTFSLDQSFVQILSIQEEGVYRRLEIVIQNAITILQEKNQKEMRFSLSIVKQLISYTLDRLKKVQNATSENFTYDVMAHVVIHVCALSVPFFASAQKNYEIKHSLLNLIEKEKSPMYNEFKTMCVNSCYDVIVAGKVYDLLENSITDGLKNALCIAIIEEMRTEHGFFNNKSQFQGTVLESMCKQKKYKDYVLYLTGHDAFIKDWTLKFLAQQCSKIDKNAFSTVSVIQSLAEKNISKQLTKTMDVLKETTLHIIKQKENSQTSNATFFSKWLEIFIPRFRHATGLSCREAKIIFLKEYPVTDFQLFEDQVISNLGKHLQRDVLQALYLPKLDQVTTTELWLKTLPKQPHLELTKHVKGNCTEQCPFCGALCDDPLKEHAKHTSTLHYPKGVTGWRGKYTKKLVVDICTSLVATDMRYFRCNCEIDCDHYKYYRDYEQDYPEWYIRPIKNTEPTAYWKWVLTTFNDDLAKYYVVKKAHIPQTWKAISQADALKSVRDAYHMSKVCFEISKEKKNIACLIHF